MQEQTPLLLQTCPLPQVPHEAPAVPHWLAPWVAKLTQVPVEEQQPLGQEVASQAPPPRPPPPELPPPSPRAPEPALPPLPIGEPPVPMLPPDDCPPSAAPPTPPEPTEPPEAVGAPPCPPPEDPPVGLAVSVPPSRADPPGPPSALPPAPPRPPGCSMPVNSRGDPQPQVKAEATTTNAKTISKFFEVADVMFFSVEVSSSASSCSPSRMTSALSVPAGKSCGILVRLRSILLRRLAKLAPISLRFREKTRPDDGRALLRGTRADRNAASSVRSVSHITCTAPESMAPGLIAIALRVSCDGQLWRIADSQDRMIWSARDVC